MTLKKFILVLDIGSTSGRGFVFELPNFNIVGKARFDVSLKCERENTYFFHNYTLNFI